MLLIAAMESKICEFFEGLLRGSSSTGLVQVRDKVGRHEPTPLVNPLGVAPRAIFFESALSQKPVRGSERTAERASCEVAEVEPKESGFLGSREQEGTVRYSKTRSRRKGEPSGQLAVSNARFGQRWFIRMQLRPRALPGRTMYV
ncbi:hypothetical protein KM043_016853 [Ampulex compressa]|nr:hypothetical protein KM043_016853 [Ampulex compressa]